MEADKCVIKIIKNKFLAFTYVEDAGKNLMQGRRAANKYFLYNVINWRRKWKHTLVSLPAKPHIQRSRAS